MKKLCVDCKHYREIKLSGIFLFTIWRECHHPDLVNEVTGASQDCAYARISCCGDKFEPKDKP